MELPWIIYSILIPSLTILLITIISFRTKFQSPSSSVDPSKYPPGKTGWPIIGESIEFFNYGLKGTPEKFVTDRMNKFSTKIFRTSLFGESFAVLCGQAGNKFLFSNEGTVVHAWWPKSVDKIFPRDISSQEATMILRQQFLPQFLKPQALQRYIPIMDTIARKHFDTCWEHKKEVIVFPLSKDYTFTVACKVMLNMEDTTRVNELAIPFAHMTSGLISIPINLPGMAYNRGIKASNFIRKELMSIIQQRKIDLSEKKASSTQDILSCMLSTEYESGKFICETEIANYILGLLIAGHDSASAAITFIIKYLAELPHIYNEVLKEQREIAKGKGEEELLNWEDIQKMKYSWNVICEVWRLAPPLQGAFREAIDDFEYAGFSVPKGWKLYWNASSTHKNPEYFEEPDKFNPSRFEGTGPPPYTYVPFGGGPRMCPGKEYAKIEILVFMYHLVRRYKWEKIDDNEKIVCDPLPKPANGLPIRIFPQSIANDQ